MFLKIILTLTVTLLLLTPYAYSGEKRGIFVLSFDDGYKNWITTIAPELQRVGGVATGFVNNSRIKQGHITFEDLLSLQNNYGWEIGTHTYNHYNLKAKGELENIDTVLRKELDDSISELQSQGLRIQSLVFPYNMYTNDIIREALKRVTSFRRKDKNPISSGIGKDSSYPGRGIDSGYHVPINQILTWINTVHENNQLLFLNGHKILPDNEFTTGKTASVTKHTITANQKIEFQSDSSTCLVPDITKTLEFMVLVKSIKGKTVTVANGNLTRFSEPETTFMIGPCMAMRLSDFRTVIEYASKKLHFRTVSEVLNIRQPGAPEVDSR